MQTSTGQDPQIIFRSWLQEHAGLIYKVARGFAASKEDWEDLTQEILLQMWRSLPRYQGHAKVSTWIYRVALNTALAWRRKERRQVGQLSLVEIQEVPVQPQDSSLGEGDELLEALYTAIRNLPKLEAGLLLMYLDDLSGREMAEILGISEVNVRVRLNRARKALGNLMKEVAHEC
jgi:RNA polymerase sigma-70 factor, ECF subfamily